LLLANTSDAYSIGNPIVFDTFPGWQQGLAITRQGDVLPTIGGKAVFFATDGVHGIEPWISDGTSTGTFMLKDVGLQEVVWVI